MDSSRLRYAFTLIEVLISVALLSLVLLGLYQSLNLQRSSNKHLHEFLQTTVDRDRVAMTLYRDLSASDGRLKIHRDRFDRLCIASTAHSLYGLSSPKVCWLVIKEDNTLVRTEGGDYHLPLKSEEVVATDRVLPHMEIFDLVRKGDDLLVVFRAAGHTPYSFLVQGLKPPAKKKIMKKKPIKSKKKKTMHRTPPGKLHKIGGER